jgi:hypothetical protein
MEMMQRAYVLFRKQEDRIFLFEDRALETPFETSMVSNIAAEIVARSHVPLRDFGMVEGHGGLLAVWGRTLWIGLHHRCRLRSNCGFGGT